MRKSADLPKVLDPRYGLLSGIGGVVGRPTCYGRARICATSALTAELRPQEEVRADLEAKAQRALGRLGEAKVMKIRGPIEAAIRAVPPASLQVLEGVPGIKYNDETVTFVAEDFQEAYDGLIELIGVATTNYSRVLVEALRASPEGSKYLTEYNDQLMGRWLDFESGRWSPPAPEPPPEGQKYHGAR